MRPCYNKLENEPLPPFADNLVFWAPLTEGDLTDHISGVEPTTDAGCSVTWDAEKQMYKFYANGSSSSYKASARYGSLDMGMLDGDAVTLVIDVEEISYSGNHYSPMLCTPDGIVESQGFNSARVNNVYYHSGIDLELHRYSVVFERKIGAGKFNVIRYQDGIHKHTTQWTAPLKLSDNIATICQLNNGNTLYSIYAKNARIYNRELTAEEVAQL